ncbi:hypothetical protein SAMN05421878_10823 [Actinobaculum suis]|uniref:General stress protein n=1 Tax=Actinobaculum suis TaxID=1657 RepID=A0A0K9ESR8_9ACTO|nr:general stress protein [Actinobaculum suis]KMY22925.1 membrane protein [Actinobaculum suis]MDY5152524.1 general stress protein [Actinobaculum suis]OCA94754.1 hypothetical protein ACU21_06085 [Actinobaculum suis]OCA95516.1 hypothetical protein ACU20_03820 [Actinobaculum suis]SDE40205.1 hypothetical protein SAMN05421878_10823 [Actinobaculum suis]
MSQNVGGRRYDPGADHDYRSITEVSSYAEAEHIIDTLSDAGFPIQNARIVGVNLESVEQVTGRMTTLRAGGMGALSGALWGAFIGLFWVLFMPQVAGQALLMGAGVGAILGGIVNAVAQKLQGGRRDFASVRTTRANSYEIQIRSAFVHQAYMTLAQAGITTF